MRRDETMTGGRLRRGGRGVRGIPAAAAALVLAIFMSLSISVAGPAAADEYQGEEAGHPLRIVAYILHPVGVVIDYLIMRPAHWLGSHEPFKTAFGHED